MDIAYGYGFKPFWFWNGEMNDDEIRWQIKEMHDKGVDGFFIHPRQGLTVPYLSETWFEKVRVAIDAAKALGVEVWLYDEYTYPSGAAGGKIMIDRPDLKARTLHIAKHDVSEGNISIDFDWGKVYDVCACKVIDGKVDWASRIDLMNYVGSIYPGMAYQDSGLTHYNKKRFFSEGCKWNVSWQVPAGDWRIYISLEQEMTGFKYFGTFIDPVNPEAVQYFIEYTHEKYKKHFADEFGKTIKGIFADETAPWGYERQMPWSPLMPKFIKEKYGYDLAAVLPALADDIGPETAKIRSEYFETITNAFTENFEGQLSRWCEANGILYTGEKPILSVGMLKYSHLPGVDVGHQKAGDVIPIGGRHYREMPKIASSAAHFYHNDRAMVEAFHSLGWDVTLADLKYNIDVMTVGGINVFVPHAYFYSTDGLRKHDAPPSCFFQLPQWKHMSMLSQYVQDVWAHLQGRRVADVLVLDFMSGFYTMCTEDMPKKRLYTKVFSDLQEQLLKNMLDFYVIDPELLMASTIDGGNLVVNGEAFKALIIPPMDYMSEALKTFIEQYKAAGGCVQYAGADEAQGTNNAFIPVLEVLKTVKPLLGFKTSRLDVGNLLACAYENDGGYHIFVMNTSNRSVHTTMSVAGNASIELTLTAFESKLIKCAGTNIVEQNITIPTTTPVLPLPIDAAWQCTPAASNALGLREWSLALPNGQTAVVGSKPIINQIMDAGFAIEPKFTQGFGTQPRMHFPEVKATYTACFTCDVKTEIKLAYEPEGILGDFKVFVNTKPIQDFKLEHEGTIKLFTADISNLIIKGLNEVNVVVDATQSNHGIVNPMYVLGDFGTENAKIVERPTTGIPFDYRENKLTYYAGDVIYKTVMNIDDVSCGVVLTLPDNMGLAVSLNINGHELNAKAYSPYAWFVPAEQLKAGGNDITMTVSTGISAFFEGEYVDPVTHEIIKI